MRQEPSERPRPSRRHVFLGHLLPSGTALNFLPCARPAMYARMCFFFFFWKALLLVRVSSWNVWTVAPDIWRLTGVGGGKAVKRSWWEAAHHSNQMSSPFSSENTPFFFVPAVSQRFSGTESLMDGSELHVMLYLSSSSCGSLFSLCHLSGLKAEFYRF